MATGNYDILVQLHEKVLNKALAMVFYKGMLKVEGKYEVATDLPDTMKPYTSFDYEVSLANEPFIDFRSEDLLFLRFSAVLKLIILSGIEIRFGVEFYVQSGLSFDISKRKMYYTLQEAKIVKITIQSEYYINKSFLDKLNFIIHEIIDKYFKNQIKELEIPIALDGINLPMMPPGDAFKLPISKADIKILNNKVVAAGVSFFQNQGSFAGLANLTNNKDCYIAIKAQAIYDVLDFWWKNTTYSKKQEFQKSVEIGFATPVARTLDTVTRSVTLGFIQTERDYENMVLNYGGEIFLDKKPVLTLKTGSLIEISNLEFIADVFANLFADVKKDVDFDTSSFIPDHITPWKDDINLKNIDENKKLLELKNRFTLQINKAEGQIRVNEQNNLAVRITNADFEIQFNKKGSTFSDNTWDKLMKFLKDRVLEKIPEIIISPSLILAGKNVFGFTLGLADTMLKITNQEIEFATNVVINELKSNTVAVPNYIGNRETKTVHLFSCNFVGDIDTEDRVGYYVMYEALSDQYKACKQCLNSYNIR
jgi:hypothetical protein